MSLTNKDLWIDPAEVESEKIKFSSHLLIGCIFLVLLSFFTWANFAVLDQVTRGDGKVIPSSSTQIIQNLDGGILAEMLVKEGDIVQKGQVIAQIENSKAQSNLSELQQRYWRGLATVARLQAQIDGLSADQINFPPEVINSVPEVAQAERALFVIQEQQLKSQLETLEQQRIQRENELAEIKVKIDSTGTQLNLAQRQFDIMKPLRDSKAVSEVEMLRMRQNIAQYDSDISAAKASLPRAEAALQEVISKIEEAKNSSRSEAGQYLAKQQTELAAIKESMADAGAMVGRTEVRSPVKGTIKDIKIRTVGGVIRPGEEIMEIVPIEDTLLIEAQIRPSDRGFIAPGQHAVVKISAYDYSIFGGLEANVVGISADTIENEKREQFFRVRLRTTKNDLLDKKTGEKLQIIPGMTATVDILTGKKTVLEYLLKPIIKAQESSLTER